MKDEIEEFYAYAESNIVRYKRPDDYIERYKRVEEKIKNRIKKTCKITIEGHINYSKESL